MIEGHDDMNLWTDKLQAVKLPDIDVSWQGMEAALNREMPGKQKKSRRRWLLLAVLLLLLIGVCNCPGVGRFHMWSSSARVTAPGKDTTGRRGNDAGRHDNDAGSSGNDMGPTGNNGGKDDHDAEVQDRDVGTDDHDAAEVHEVGKAGNDLVTKSKDTRNSKTGRSGGKHTAQIENFPGGTGQGAHSGEERKIAGGEKLSPGTVPAASKGNDGAGVKRKDSIAKKGRDSVVANIKKIPPPKPIPAKEKKNEPAAPEGGWVIGVGLNQFFTVGEQEKSDYNSGGTTGGLSDYIPVPMVRYNFNKRVFVQLEAQFNSPQYTSKGLEAGQSQADSVSPVQAVQSSVYIKKLFYVNIPLSVHFSPLPNVYVGTGLQYSILSNGVGLFEDKLITTGGPDSVEASKVENFKGDSVYQKMKTHEFRWLVDGNYQYKQFVLGIRYNRALSKFINVRISDTQVTQARNSSLQLYLRYILWDQRKHRQLPAK